jgi:hypothetical protein
MTVSFSGFQAINGKSTTVSAYDDFDVYYYLPGGAGTVYAQTKDWWGRQSNQAADYISP